VGWKAADQRSATGITSYDINTGLPCPLACCLHLLSWAGRGTQNS